MGGGTRRGYRYDVLAVCDTVGLVPVEKRAAIIAMTQPCNGGGGWEEET